MPKKDPWIRSSDKPFEDKDGNWTGVGYRATKPTDEAIAKALHKHKSIDYNFASEGEIINLKRKCKDGDNKACNELKAIEEKDKEHLKRLMAIATWDEEPPKLKEPSGKE